MFGKLFIAGRTVILPILSFGNKVIRWLAKQTHRAQFLVQWGGTPTPEWFDHFLDLYYQWGQPAGNAFWLERGVFSLLAIQKNANVLELCCGDGFNSKYFYSYRVAHILSCDFDPTAIAHAKRCNRTERNEFLLADIRTEMPDGTFDNVIWDAAIEHFTPDEIKAIMENIKKRLTPKGTLSGYTIVERTDGQKSLSQHEYEFKSKEDLMRFLTPWFSHVKVFETVYPSRHNLYFYASDEMVPFEAGWSSMIDKGVS